MTSGTRLYQVLRLIHDVIGGYSPVVRVTEHYISIEHGIEYLSLRINISRPNASITIREYWRQGRLVAYGYYVRVGGYEEWWDNRPHHPELNTHPHHRHVAGRVLPLHKPSLQDFLERVKELLSTARSSR